MIHTKSYRFSGCEGHLSVTSVTSLITKVDVVIWLARQVSLSSLTAPCVHPSGSCMLSLIVGPSLIEEDHFLIKV